MTRCKSKQNIIKEETMKNWKSILALLLAVVMTVALMSGCGPKTSVA